MPTQTLHTLTRLLTQSVLLSRERREELLTALPSLTETQAHELLRILRSEDDILGDIAKQAITRAVAQGDTEFLEELDAFIHESLRRLRKAEEGAERGTEQERTEHFFDDVP
jgi:hypothetical protein